MTKYGEFLNKRISVQGHMYVTRLILSEGHILNLFLDGLQFSEQISTCYHLMVSVGLENVGGHLSAATNLILHLHPLFLLEGQSCCLENQNGLHL